MCTPRAASLSNCANSTAKRCVYCNLAFSFSFLLCSFLLIDGTSRIIAWHEFDYAHAVNFAIRAADVPLTNHSLLYNIKTTALPSMRATPPSTKTTERTRVPAKGSVWDPHTTTSPITLLSLLLLCNKQWGGPAYDAVS